MSQRIQTAWENFAKQVIPKDAPPEQFKGMKLAFYGGVTSLFTIQVGEISALPDEVAELEMCAIGEELHEYAQLAQEGKH